MEGGFGGRYSAADIGVVSSLGYLWCDSSAWSRMASFNSSSWKTIVCPAT